MVNLLLALLLATPADLDFESLRKVGVQHGKRIKPFDTFARELIRYLSGKENFQSYKDPKTGAKVEVFPTSDPLTNTLMLAASPEGWSEKPFILVQNPDVKKAYGLDPDRSYFSIHELSAIVGALENDLRKHAGEDTPMIRALQEVYSRHRQATQIVDGSLLRMIPAPHGEADLWISPPELGAYLRGAAPPEIARALVGLSRAKLEEIDDRYRELLDAAHKGDAAAFKSVGVALAAGLRELNPGIYPREETLAVEVKYNALKPFSYATWGYHAAFWWFLLAFVFSSKTLRWIALLLMSASLAMHSYGMILRGLIAGRVPFSNMYESMTLLAGGAVVVTLVLELIFRSRVLGISGTLIGWLGLMLNDAIAAFDPFVAPLVPALKSYWMQIHVPCIMLGYAMGTLLTVLGHIYLFGYLFRPGKTEWFASLDKVMYRVLQLAALFLLGGVLLGAVWAGEAWGRYWGWDMKETWALIVLVAHVAMLHGRIAGALRGLGTALCSIVSFALLFLCYYGVNFMFGKGLHAYGFGAKTAYTWLVIFFAFELALLVTGSCVGLARRRSEPPPPQESAPA